MPDNRNKSSACVDGLTHYEVVSPEMVHYSYLEPPEPFRCWGQYLAKNSREARIAAVKDLSEFGEWISKARGDGVPPYKGLRVFITRCEHGVCWGCLNDGLQERCATCEADFAEADVLANG